jgi:hypothetical protein
MKLMVPVLVGILVRQRTLATRRNRTLGLTP